MDSRDSMKNNKSTINPVNVDDKCFQYAATVALNHKEIRKRSGRISENWKDIVYSSGKGECYL